MRVLKGYDGFLWADVTPIAESLWYTGDWDLYAIYDDGSEHMIESEQELEALVKEKTTIAIELCLINDIINIQN
jgi:hypothetical protein